MQYPPPKSPCPRPGCGVLCGRAGGRAAPRPARRRAVGGCGSRVPGPAQGQGSRVPASPAGAGIPPVRPCGARLHTGGGERRFRPSGGPPSPLFPRAKRGSCLSRAVETALSCPLWCRGKLALQSSAPEGVLAPRERLEKTAERCSLALTRGERGGPAGGPGVPPRGGGCCMFAPGLLPPRPRV